MSGPVAAPLDICHAIGWSVAVSVRTALLYREFRARDNHTKLRGSWPPEPRIEDRGSRIEMCYKISILDPRSSIFNHGGVARHKLCYTTWPYIIKKQRAALPTTRERGHMSVVELDTLIDRLLPQVL